MIEQIKSELVRLGLADNDYSDSIVVYDEGAGVIRLSDGSADWYGRGEVALNALKRHDEMSWEDFWEVFSDDGVANLGN
ncbi:hypothetical protein ABEV74_10905 [Paenibacillus cisolokensis]|uniref:hypothetical protein n=1 Tax=Paenibacillus cisolokensis TaxID=1658519 RepID=UPI003D2C1DDA